MEMMEATTATATVVASPLLVSTPPECCYDHEYLTGYLEDALFQFSASMMKRQRLTHPHTTSTTHGERQYHHHLLCGSPTSDCLVFPSTDHDHHQFDYGGGGGGGWSIESMEIEKNYCSRQMMMMSSSSTTTTSTTDFYQYSSPSSSFTDTKSRKHHQMERSAATTVDISGTTIGINSPPLPSISSSPTTSSDDHEFWSMTTTRDHHHPHNHTHNNNNNYCSSKLLFGSNSSSTSLHNEHTCSGKPFIKPNHKPQAALQGSVINHNEKKKKVGLELMIRRRVAYPFATVRPVGDEDHIITLEEINKKLLMPPTRPVRHPVGKYACKPNVVSAEGSRGLSGKMVVGLTRIHTAGGKGTITIIRTRG